MSQRACRFAAAFVASAIAGVTESARPWRLDRARRRAERGKIIVSMQDCCEIRVVPQRQRRVLVVVLCIMKILRGATPAAEVMTGVSVIALAANAICLWLLWHHKNDDVNMGSAWLCSRNDVVANVGVLMAGMAVAVTGWAWPDIVVGLVIACLFSSSGLKLLRGL